jgi:alpha-galactosidase
VTAYPSGRDPIPLERTAAEWHGAGITVTTTLRESELAITLAAPSVAMERVHLRWRMAVDPGLLVLGDAWERSYGELGWRGIIPERVLPWYFAMAAGEVCHGYGVKTQAGALCFWQVDPEGASLWLDVCNGGGGVLLGQRVLHAATVVTRPGVAGEGGQAALAAFCRQMCSVPSPAAQPVYGFNDWYYAYGKNTARQILADTDYLASLSTGNRVRPFSVVDDGWNHPAAFPDMASLAREIKKRQVRPGIWIRPLQAPAGTPEHLLLPGVRFGDRQERAKEFAYDPTVPEAKERVLAKVKQVVGWGYELVKHDF